MTRNIGLNLDRHLGALVGLAVGDAVGTTLEFKEPGTFAPLKDMVGGGPFHLKPGEWTDDTSMALCLAESLIVCKGFDFYDQMFRYVQWYKRGKYSVKGFCFDIGKSTKLSLDRFIATGEVLAGDPCREMAGNGSLMRLVPVVMAYTNFSLEVFNRAVDSSKTTHAAPQCLAACKWFSILLWCALWGWEKDKILDTTNCYREFIVNHYDDSLVPVMTGSFKTKNPPEIQGTGYVVDCLEAALWAFYTTNTYQECILAAANLGNDADTTAAVAGQIAGAYYGLQGIPEHWVNQLAMKNTIISLATELYELTRKSR